MQDAEAGLARPGTQQAGQARLGVSHGDVTHELFVARQGAASQGGGNATQGAGNAANAAHGGGHAAQGAVDAAQGAGKGASAAQGDGHGAQGGGNAATPQLAQGRMA